MWEEVNSQLSVGYEERKSNSDYCIRCRAITSKLQVMMDAHT